MDFVSYDSDKYGVIWLEEVEPKKYKFISGTSYEPQDEEANVKLLRDIRDELREEGIEMDFWFDESERADDVWIIETNKEI